MKKPENGACFYSAILKFDLKMKLTFLLLVFSLCRINASIYSQNTRITLDVNNVTYEELFREIKKDTDFKIFYKNSEIDYKKKVSINVVKKRIEYVLDALFNKTDITYTIIGKQVVLANSKYKNYAGVQQQYQLKGSVVDRANLPLLGMSIIKKGTSTGVVTDFDGNFTIVVSSGDVLIIKGLGFKTKEVTITNQKELKIILEDDVEALDEVVVTDGFKKVDKVQFTGVATRLELEDIKIDGTADPARLLEGRDAGVVVDNLSGSFGASPRIRIRGNASINGNNNPLYVVDGVILEDNVELDQQDLASGDVNSLIGSSIAGINADDIASFTILKDASATALYGARASNGVVVITTKRGKKGKISVNINTSYNYRLRPRYADFNVLNSQQELSVYSELVQKGLVDLTTSQRSESFGVLGRYYFLRGINQAPIGANGGLSDDYFRKYQTANTDWFKTLFKDLSLIQNHSVNISGGSDDSNYFFSFSYLDDEGQTLGDRADRWTSRLNTNFNISDKLSIGASVSISIRDQVTPGTNNRNLDPISGAFVREFDINPFSYALSNSRSMTAYDQNGDLDFFRKNYAPFNIIDELGKNFINIDVLDATFQTDLNYKITNNLKLNTVLNLRKAITQRNHNIGDTSNQANAYRASEGILEQVNPFLYQDRSAPGSPVRSVLPEGGINIYNEDVLDYSYLRGQLSWNKIHGDKHEFSTLLGAEVKSTKRQDRQYTGFGIVYNRGYLINTNPDIINQSTDNGDQYFRIRNTVDKFTGLFFNAGYTYDNRYTINGTVRYDGSNLLGRSSQGRYLTSYNVSGGWNIHKEKWMNADWVSFIKLKATYGLSGGRGPQTQVSNAVVFDGNQVNSSATLQLIGQVPLRPQDIENVIDIRSLNNEQLTFEKLREFSVGLEYGLFNDRLAGELGYYKRNSFDLIGNFITSGIGGLSIKSGNYADMKVDGYEFSISTVNLKTSNFEWRTNFNVGYNTEKITNLNDNPRLVDLTSGQGNPFLDREISALYSTRFAGLNDFGIPTFFDADDNVVTNIDLQQRQDVEKILTYEGPTQPRGSGGFSNTFTYKNLSLTANISFKFDYKIRLNGDFAPSYSDDQSLPKELINRWRLPGDQSITNIPSIVETRVILSELGGFVGGNGDVIGEDNAYELYNLSSLRVADGSYARLRSLSLGYKIPRKFASKLGFSSGSLRIQGENLFLLFSDDKLQGQDPEFFNTGGVALPLSKTFSCALSLGF